MAVTALTMILYWNIYFVMLHLETILMLRWGLMGHSSRNSDVNYTESNVDHSVLAKSFQCGKIFISGLGLVFCDILGRMWLLFTLVQNFA